jgi:ATP-binding cassette, subfamily C, bacterial LapB
MTETTTQPDWAALSVWLSRRLSLLDGRLHALTPPEVIELGKSMAEAASGPTAAQDLKQLLKQYLKQVGLSKQVWIAVPKVHSLPMLGSGVDTGLCLIHGRSPESGYWVIETPHGRAEWEKLPADLEFCSVALGWREKMVTGALAVFKQVLMQYKKPLIYFALASLLINLLALLTSLYSMQVYDRVIPSRGVETLVVLTVGVCATIIFELILKFLRSTIMDRVVQSADVELSHRIFERLMSVRMDQFPSSVGTLASQLRSYELIRGFAYSATTYLLIDTPFALVFLILIFMIGGPVVAAIPLVFFVVALIIGLTYKNKTEQHTRESQASSNRKLGLLVEAVSSAETIKAQGLRWHFLNRWNALTQQNVTEDRKVRHINESSSYYAATLQQLSYVLLVATGAYVASTSTDLTSGGLIACSILSGRVLQPVTMLPGLLTQWANSKSALTGIDAIFKLQLDHHEVQSPLPLLAAEGTYALDNVKFGYPGQTQNLQIPKWNVTHGEKIGIIGGIGSGKSTFLKLLAGLYQANEGRVLLDQLDIQHISRLHLSQHIGLISQTVQLFAGTLKDNLVAGLIGITEENIREACQATGLSQFVGTHPKGLDMPINEAGNSVSGGQRQLIGLTRLLLTRPAVWLLDEPTSSMDDETERQTLSVLAGSVGSNQTLIVVTHKASVLALVSRLVVMAGGRIVLDGPRDAVLAHLRDAQKAKSENPNGSPINSVAEGAHASASSQTS